jgi:hypothetical protein
MTLASYPYVAQATTDIEYSRFFRELQDNGVVGGYGSAGFKVTAGGTNLVLDVAAGSAILNGYFARDGAPGSVAVSTADANPRVDRVILRLDLTQPVGSRVVLTIVKGVAVASNPVATALVQTDTGIFEISLAQVPVPAGATSISAASVVDDRSFIGNRIGDWTTATRPSSPQKRRLGFNEDLGLWEFWTGATWAPLNPQTAYSSLSGIPLSFAPSAHTHDASDIASGILAIGRVPTGVSGTTVALGNHVHDAGAITSGTLPITRGGTGAITAAGVLSSIGAAASVHSHAWADITNPPAAYANALKIGGRTIFVQSATPAGVDGDIWFKI